jgi:predicted RNase H-like HicB family nuclease
MNPDSRKRYSVMVGWNALEVAYVARCNEIPACVGVDVDPCCALEQAMWAIDDHLEYRQDIGLPPPRAKSEKTVDP